MAPNNNAQPVLSVLEVGKSYGAVRALNGVTLIVQPGEVHGLIGQNGAGKSTLMGIASGAVVPDAGQVLIDGELSIGDPHRARQLGLAMVRQEPALMPDLSVAENLYLGVTESCRPPIGDLEVWAAGLLKRWRPASSIQPGARVNTLASEQRFIVDIVRALACNPRVLVLDEPTEHLQSKDVERLFECIAEVTGGGTGVIYISHRIREVRQIADRVTVLRDGQSQGTYHVEGLSEQKIIELIVGASVSAEFPAKGTQHRGSPILEVAEYRGHGIDNVSMNLFPGEIIGLAGVDGNGQREFLRALAGLNPAEGHVKVNGLSVVLRHPDNATKAGLQFISNDRHAESVFEDLSITANFSLRSLAKDVRGGIVNARGEGKRASKALSALAVKLGSQDDPIKSLSGGNQQKVVFGGALAAEPTVLLVDEPTQGVDIGSRLEIYRILRKTAAEGRAAIVVSSDAGELAGLCDRVLVFSRGSVAAELVGEKVSENEIISAILTATNVRQGVRAKSGHSTTGPVKLTQLLATDWAPLVMIAIVVALLGVFTAALSENYLGARNFSGMLALISTLALVACAQQALMLIGGIDLSVGPLMGVIVVSQSFLLSGPLSGLGVVSSLVALLVIAMLVGAFNWVLVEPVC